MLQNEVKLSGFLSKYAVHVVTRLAYDSTATPFVCVRWHEPDFYPKIFLRGLTWASPEVAEARDPNGR